jgi:carbon monoxide dehydrogenase subunit G
MKVSGSRDLAAARDRVWMALRDPDVLERTVPGCLSLERTGRDRYTITVMAGVGSIRGIYAGTVSLHDLDPPTTCTVHATAQGAPGTVEATARVRLADLDGGGTRVTYEGEAVIGGTIAAVGQRLLAAAAKRNADDFFDAVEAELATPPPTPPTPVRRRRLEGPLMLAGAALIAVAVLLGRWARR